MRIRILLTTALLAVTPIAGAAAEPQILGLLAQDDPIPLHCNAIECFVEVSAFCMEPERPSPDHLTVYHPFENTDLALTVRTADGEETTLPLDSRVAFESVRGYAAVRISMPAAALAKVGATEVALRVGKRVTLMPQAIPGDKRPHEPQEIALAKGPRRTLGDKLVDDGGARADAARLLSRAINGLPEWGRVDDRKRAGLWRAQIETAGLAEEDGMGVSVARKIYDRCLAKDPAETGFTMRQCLEGGHDHLIWQLNRQYWLSAAGS